MQNQHTASFQQLIPVGSLQVKLSSNNWNVRKEMYEQLLYLFREGGGDGGGVEIGGKLYTVKKLIPFFQDIVDEEHPGVLIAALLCVEMLIERGMCSGREFVKLTDQGFDKFPLKINKGKEIMQKFADIIEKIDLQPQFLLKKLNSTAHEKCVIFALEVVSMLGMTQLLAKVQEMGRKHPKSAVREVALEIERQLEELENGAHEEMEERSFESGRKEIENIPTQNLNKAIKNKNRKKTPTKGPQPASFSRNEMEVLEKASQFEQLKNSKDQQKFSESLMEVFEKYFKGVREGRPMPPLPLNQLTNLSYIIRVMVQSNNAIISTNGLKILKCLTQHNSPILPRSFPLLFLFQKFRLHATHQINQLLYQLCDSLLLCNALSTNRSVDLLQAVSQGAGNKKTNVQYGSFMVFLRTVALLYGNQPMFLGAFSGDDGGLADVLAKVNEGDTEKIRVKVYKLLVKCLENFTAKLSDDKKYDEKLQDIRITMSLAYGSGTSTTQSAVSSIENLKNKTLKKTFSQVSPKVQTNNSQTKPIIEDPKKLRSTHSVRSQAQTNAYKILNPQQKSNKILALSRNPTPGSLSSMKKLILESLLQFQESLDEGRFQLFYYGEVIENFMNLYEPCEKTSELVSEYLLQLLVKVSTIKNNIKNNGNTKLLREGLRNTLKICLCSLVLGDTHLSQILTNFSQNLGIENLVQALILLNESKKQNKVKKKNKKVVLAWIDGNVPAQCLSDRLFQVIERIEKGVPLGVQQEREQEGRMGGTFGREEEGEERLPVVESRLEDPKMKKKITFNSELINDNFEVARTKKEQPLKPKHQPKQLPSYTDLKPQPISTVSPIPALQSSQISKISYKEDQSLIGSGCAGSTERSIDNNINFNLGLQGKRERAEGQGQGYGQEGEGDEQDNSYYQQYYTQYKRYKEMEDQPDFGLNKQKREEKEVEEEEGEEEDVELDNKIEDYKEYIKKIRETYLPPEYINKEKEDKNKQEIKVEKMEQKREDRVPIPSEKPPAAQQEDEQEQDQEQKQEEEQNKFEYKLINVNKLNYMLNNASNPYSHLRNQILLPFKKCPDQPYFLKQLNLYITSLPTLNHPQPYNSLLLTIILLFSQIHTNRNLITPLQQLYEHMATLVSTNEFLRIIISLFHSVIEETSEQLRAFLITILTKSVARLMPFCDDPVELLRDLSQFYNVGENVYFQMYEREYGQICLAIEGEALYDLVERALIKQHENLVVIVESWFETKLKTKIKQYMKQIMEQNQEEGIDDQHRDGQAEYF